ncbi:hypothetical protein BGZ94_008192 [Podila epigama]|nr:hypothetical protein BGZ94_008192 [Podila epigama]
MFVPILSFLVNLATAVSLLLVTIGNLATPRINFTTGLGPLGGWLDKPYAFISFGLWSFCEGVDNVVVSCSDPKLDNTLEPIPALHAVDQLHVAEAVRSFNKVTVLFIPATCVAFVALFLSFLSLWPRFRKRWIHALSTFLSVLVAIACVILMITAFTVFGSRRIQFQKYLDATPIDIEFGPGVWITLALVPLTVFGALFGSVAVCCPGRRQQADIPETKEQVAEPSA